MERILDFLGINPREQDSPGRPHGIIIAEAGNNNQNCANIENEMEEAATAHQMGTDTESEGAPGSHSFWSRHPLIIGTVVGDGNKCVSNIKNRSTPGTTLINSEDEHTKKRQRGSPRSR